MSDEHLTPEDRRHLKEYDEIIAGYDRLIATSQAAFWTLLAIPVAVVIALIIGRLIGIIE